MENVIVILIIALIVGFAGGYVYRAKKRGEKCIGCPQSRNCGGCNTPCSQCAGPRK